MDKRVIMRIEVKAASKKSLDNFCDRTGMTKVAAVSRLINWFCSQPHGVQAILQGLLPAPLQQEIAEIILGRLAASKDGNGATKRINGHRNRINLMSQKPHRNRSKN